MPLVKNIPPFIIKPNCVYQNKTYLRFWRVSYNPYWVQTSFVVGARKRNTILADYEVDECHLAVKFWTKSSSYLLIHLGKFRFKSVAL